MFVPSIRRYLVVALSSTALLAHAVPAAAQALSTTEQDCINGLNTAGQKVAATQGKDNISCIKDDGNGKLTGMTADMCLTADRKGKVAGAATKTTDAQTSKCGSLPPYGATSATTVNTAAKGEELSLVTDVFGPSLDTVILTDSAGKSCQGTVSKTYEKYVATYLKEYNGCKKTNMKAGTIMNEPSMEACLGQDPKGKIGKASQKMLDGLDKKCIGVTLGTAFPGECAAAVGNAAFRDCVQSTAICHACRAVNKMDGISRGCDLLDNGALDSTCVQCGNGTIEAPETCDDSGESATCDSDCTAATCGDSNVNATAGETCDDGDASDTDPCPTTCIIATCGDGFICSEAGCNTGPSAGVEQCDNAGANSDVTPNACRTNCANPSCGDSVIDTGETCDTSGESITCDVNCTIATCGDGTTNATAGEQCDGAGETMSCDTDCTNRVCGDGTVNVTAGEECDDGNTQSGDGCSSTCLCGPGSGEGGCQDAQCPNRGRLVLYAATTGITCTNNGDCIVGQCDTALGVCTTATELDTGWTGIAHDVDTNDQVVMIDDLRCAGPFTPGPEPCGVCDVVGLSADTGDCRCANDNRVKCDTPFAADANDCGGNICNCYYGAPLPQSFGNTPYCIVNRFANDISGTANVDTGSEQVNTNLASAVYLGVDVLTPCPSCGGTCTAPPANVGDPCAHDYQCDTTPASGDGVCANYDPIPGDGLRQGTCYKGLNNGATCDGGATNTSFPAPGGGSQSLDCFPSSGLMLSSSGLRIDLAQTTGSVSLSSNVVCGFNAAPELCPCGLCTGDTSTTCTSNADCTGIGTCAKLSQGHPRQNQCSDSVCTDVGGGKGACLANPPVKFCDGVTRADGGGFLACNNNTDCSDFGTITGACTLTEAGECFLPTISATGVQDPNFPVSVATFCIAPTGSSFYDSVAGLPGPGRLKNVTSAETFCASDPGTNYTPGVGGCP